MICKLLCFGKASKAAGIEEERLLPRLRRLSLKVEELKESKQSAQMPRLAEEATLIRKKLALGAALVVLAEEGECPTSVQLARKIEKFEESGVREIVFVIGSAYGIDPELKVEAKWLMSLSRLTLTHDHARILLVEQIYRAQCILEGHPYHHV
jgi:23S rRNA (pseudouridine1915-N3)-methyltransferase